MPEYGTIVYTRSYRAQLQTIPSPTSQDFVEARASHLAIEPCPEGAIYNDSRQCWHITTEEGWRIFYHVSAHQRLCDKKITLLGVTHESQASDTIH
mgnify:CR=1 FL=1